MRGNWPPDTTGEAAPGVSLSRIRPGTDVSGLFRALDHDDVWEHIPGGRPPTPRALGDRMQPYAYLITVDGAPGGSSSYILDDTHIDDIEIGATYFAKAHWGTGLNRTVKIRMIDVAFAAGARHVRFRTDERNDRSASAIRKLGARDAGTKLEEWIRRDGTRRTSLLFTLSSDEWIAHRTHRGA